MSIFVCERFLLRVIEIFKKKKIEFDRKVKRKRERTCTLITVPIQLANESVIRFVVTIRVCCGA